MMQASVLSIIVAISTVTVSQRYKKIPLSTEGDIKFEKLIPEYGPTIFEMKTCYNGYIALSKDVDEDVYVMAPYKVSGKIEFFKHPNISTSVASGTYPYTVDCLQFYKFKVTWIQSTLALWVDRPTGWQMLLKWKDPDPYTGDFKYIRVAGRNAAWKIYQTEYTTSPFRTTCVNF